MAALKGKTLIVSGASRGIGKALAVQLAAEGVNLVLNARSKDSLLESRDACLSRGGTAEAVPGDIAAEGTAASLVEAARDIGGFFGFVHVAGVLHPGPTLWELSPGDFAQIFAASVNGAHQLISHSYPVLLEKKEGMAVFFGSGAAEKVQPGIGAYCAAKAAEEHLARQAAQEAPEISVLIYRPGIVETRMQVQARQAEGGAAESLHRVFRSWKEEGMLIEPDESAAALVKLMQGDLRSTHGKTVDVRDM